MILEKVLSRNSFALKVLASLMEVRNMHEAWSQRDPLNAYFEVQKIMHYKLYKCVRKHFGVSSSHELPAKNEPGYHPLQNVNCALGYLSSKV